MDKSGRWPHGQPRMPRRWFHGATVLMKAVRRTDLIRSSGCPGGTSRTTGPSGADYNFIYAKRFEVPYNLFVRSVIVDRKRIYLYYDLGSMAINRMRPNTKYP